jgi:hypothetical protein
MNPKYQLISDILWVAHPTFQSMAAFAMYRRALHRKFPVFFIYLLFQIVTFAPLFYLHRTTSYEAYFYLYWSYFAISLALGFKVIHEIFLDVFRPYYTLKDLGSVLFKWAALVMLLVAGVVAAASPNTDQGPLVQAVLTVQRCVRVTQCGLILFLLVFSRYLGISKRQHSFGIALGFGFFAIEELIMVALRAASYVSETSMNLADMSSYNIAILIWFGYAMAKSPARDVKASLLASQRWEQSLSDIQHPEAADSLIPMFEGMVDRAFSRNNRDVFTLEPEPEESVSTRNALPTPEPIRSRSPLKPRLTPKR